MASRSLKHSILSLVVFCIAVSTVAAEDAAKSGDEAVMTLTSSNFDSFTKEHEISLVEFYAPWCGHCKKLAPEYEKAAKTLIESGSNVRLGKVDATKEEELAKKYEVSGYPTIKLMRKGKAEDYKGGRTADSIVSWIQTMTGPAVQVLAKQADAEAAAGKAAVGYVGAFSAKDNEQFKTFQAVAEDNRQLGSYVAYIDSKAKNDVTVYRKGEGVSGSHPVTKKDELQQFCKEERFPLFGTIDGENYSDHLESGRDIVWFAAEKEDYESATKAITDAAKEYRSKNNFVWLNTEQFKDHAQSALGVKDFPSLVVQTMKGRFVYPHNIFDTKKIVAFLKDVAADKVEKFLMSDEIPEVTDEAVRVVVGKSFKDVVFQDDKDVVLEVYAPWCGHCKKFEPIYKEFAEKFSTSKHLVVAKMDGTTNESPVPNFEWKGYPTVFFVPAGSETPKIYEGDRTLESLTTFVKKHISKPLEPEAKVEAKEEL